MIGRVDAALGSRRVVVLWGLAAIGVVVALTGAGLLLPRGLPFGIVVLGLVFGSLNSLVAVGIVLVYRANRVVNFAQAELGVVAAVLAIQLILLWRWNYFLAIGAGLAGALLVGALVELTIIRRFRTAPRLIVAVATIGLAQILGAFGFLIPTWWTGQNTGLSQTFATPFEFSFTISPVIYNGNHVLAVLVVPAVLVALALFLRYTDHGVAMRAAPENDERAQLLGIPVGRLSTIAWSIAALLSALAVILRTPILGFTAFSVSGGGPSLLLRTLAAALIARMERSVIASGAAIGLGIVHEAAVWNFANTVYADTVMVGVIFVALLAHRDHFTRASHTGISKVVAVRPVRPIPEELRRLPEVRLGVAGLWSALVLFVLLLPVFTSPSTQQLVALIFIYSIVAVSLVVLTGWAGQVSLGQFALAGFGGAVVSVLVGRHGWDLFAALLVGMVAAGMAALLIGLPALRITGPFLAVTTIAFAVAAGNFVLQERYFPWLVEEEMARPHLFGGRIDIGGDWAMYMFTLVILALVLGAARNLRRTRTGRAIVAARDNELASQASSLDTVRLKLKAFAISGALAGLAGGLYVLHQHGVPPVRLGQPTPFGPEVSLRMFSMVVIGGLGSVPGAILGAVYVRSAEFFLPGQWSFLASGGALLLLLLILPGGLGDLLYRGRDLLLRLVSERHGIVVPSLVADRSIESRGEERLMLTRLSGASALRVGANGNARAAASQPKDPGRTQAGKG